ncbi:hypothetical protein JAAARDRAFT_640271 [Jaapia argillacea MUCL 33604]|uniref:Uncharacterized protein n=1 Tax=Jaapia argillacea MUCL 33604 TaxID=933084 RepID=A0A067P6U7_9AGAM|nr:hypothetical protein JAAARDRAFT_640271 [Jaapia argillacea MUCL 33604]
MKNRPEKLSWIFPDRRCVEEFEDFGSTCPEPLPSLPRGHLISPHPNYHLAAGAVTTLRDPFFRFWADFQIAISPDASNTIFEVRPQWHPQLRMKQALQGSWQVPELSFKLLWYFLRSQCTLEQVVLACRDDPGVEWHLRKLLEDRAHSLGPDPEESRLLHHLPSLTLERFNGPLNIRWTA